METKKTRAPKLTPALLAAELGPDLAARIVARYAGRRIPNAAGRIERDLAVVAEVDDGATYAEVAERHGLSPSHVERIARSYVVPR